MLVMMDDHGNSFVRNIDDVMFVSVASIRPNVDQI